jgi:hypothetical protein
MKKIFSLLFIGSMAYLSLMGCLSDDKPKIFYEIESIAGQLVKLGPPVEGLYQAEFPEDEDPTLSSMEFGLNLDFKLRQMGVAQAGHSIFPAAYALSVIGPQAEQRLLSYTLMADIDFEGIPAGEDLSPLFLIGPAYVSENLEEMENFDFYGGYILERTYYFKLKEPVTSAQAPAFKMLLNIEQMEPTIISYDRVNITP